MKELNRGPKLSAKRHRESLSHRCIGARVSGAAGPHTRACQPVATTASARGSIQSASPAWRDTEQPIGIGAVINPSIALAHARFPVSLDFLLVATIGDDAQAGSHFIVIGHIEPLMGVDAGSLILVRAENDKFKMTMRDEGLASTFSIGVRKIRCAHQQGRMPSECGLLKVRLDPDSGRNADIAEGPSWVNRVIRGDGGHVCLTPISRPIRH